VNTEALALSSWRWEPAFLAALLVFAFLYWRGWRLLHREQPDRYPAARLASFQSGLLIIGLAICSPLDAFANLLLQVHMIQHLLLLMVAPPLLWLGQPVPAFARSLPAPLFRAVFAPFLKSPALRNCGAFLVHPIVAWLLFQLVLVSWHVPYLFELSLSDPGWHQIEHISFLSTALLFWWPVIPVWPSKPPWPRAAFIVYLLAADLVNTALSAFFAFSGGVLYASYRNGPHLFGISAADDQVAAGVIMWVPGSLAYLIPALLIATRFISGDQRWRQRIRNAQLPALPAASIVPPRRPLWDLLQLPVARWLFRRPFFRRALQVTMFLLAAMVMWDGWFGPQVAALNLGGVLPWIEWRGLVIIALLIAGNFFCMACPFLLPRELGKRLFRPHRRWPRGLRSKWLAAALVVAYLMAYEAFSLWNRPAWTASIVAGYFVAAFAIDSWFKGASFCKYVCPIGQFNFVQSLLSPLEVKVREPAICQSCHTFDCIRGNQQQRGCELALFQPKKLGNLDCTFCLDCVYACPHQNVGLLAVVPGATLLEAKPRSSIGALFKRWDWAVLALALTFGAYTNAAAMIQPVAARLATWTVPGGVLSRIPAVLLLYAICFGAGALAIVFSAVLSHRLTSASGAGLVTRFSLSLVPLGAAMWLGHSLFHFLSASNVAAAFERFFAAHRIAVTLPSVGPYITPDQILSCQLVLLGIGWVGCVLLTWRNAVAIARTLKTALLASLPWMAVSAALYLAGVWIFTQPMEMRGTGVSFVTAPDGRTPLPLRDKHSRERLADLPIWQRAARSLPGLT
jgi:cytochrome c oxidase assembly factor CtaG/ferredoxin